MWRSLPADKMHAAVHDRRVILDAVRARDPDSAAQAAEAHARAIRVRWRDLFGSQPRA
jgi:DNA-binding FadR family transcriptional regulator